MADKEDTKAAKEEAAPKAKAADLPPAGESSNPEVHQALAELDIAQRNREEAARAASSENIATADEQIKAAEAKLKDLGVSP